MQLSLVSSSQHLQVVFQISEIYYLNNFASSIKKKVCA